MSSLKVFKPHDYQANAIDWVLEKPFCGLWLDMGLGKTVVTLTAIYRLVVDMLLVDKVLVIAPKRVAEHTWVSEAAKWAHLKGLKVVSVTGNKAQRVKALQSEAHVYVINRENIPWLTQTYRWSFPMVVLDESQSFKNPSSKRFKALKAVRPRIERLVQLTGTPAPNTYMDLFSQIYLLDGGQRLCKTITAFRETFFTPDKRNRDIVYSYKLKKGAKEAIEGRISDLCMSMKASDYLTLPDRTDAFLEVKLSPPAEKLYKQFESDLVYQFQTREIVAATAAVLVNKLAQIASGSVYDEEGNAILLHADKYEVLDEVLEGSGNTLVFYNYKFEKEQLLSRYKGSRALESAKDVDDWNAGKVPVLVCHPLSAGHGLNLQAGGSTVVWFSLNWSLEAYQQGNARLHRQGQDKPVRVIHLVAKDTVDERIAEALESKAVNQDALIGAVNYMIDIDRRCRYTEAS